MAGLSAQPDYTIYLHSGSRVPDPGIPSEMYSTENVNGYYYSVLQFYDLPEATIKHLLTVNRIELLEYIPNYAWLAKIPAGADLQSLPIRAEIKLTAQDKIFPTLQNDSYDECLLDGGGIGVRALLYPRVSKSASRPMLERAGFENLNLESGIIDLTIGVSELETLASLPIVMVVLPQECDPVEEGIRGRSLVRANLSHNGIVYSGNGVQIAIADDGPVMHPDLRNRIFDMTTEGVGDHGEMTVGLAAGAGNINPNGIGMATGSDVYLFDIEGYPHQTNAEGNYENYGIQITSTSYGESCGGYYGYTAKEIDEQVYNNIKFFHVYSAGNRGYDGCNEVFAPFANEDATRFANITGGRKSSKNVIAVGNLFLNDTLRSTSSRGPTNDGRIKPDICAPGQGNLSIGPDNSYQQGGGTSAAAPVVAGAGAIMYEAYADMNDGDTPASGLIKSMFLCSAEDLGRKGPDYEHGWGRLHLGRALEVLINGQYRTDSINYEETDTHEIVIPEGVGQARMMVYWMDTCGSIMSSKALVNDLDISLLGEDGTSYLPHVLSHYPDFDSLSLPAYPGYDHVNNMEQVILDNPTPGVYTLNVDGYLVPEGPQEYFVVYSFIKDEIRVTYPFGGEGFVPGEKEILRWDAYGDEETFLIEYSLDGMESWETIEEAVPGHLRCLEWIVPQEVSGKAYIRISRNGQEAYSENNFTIIETPAFDFDYVNMNTAAISWYPVPGATEYEVFRLGEKYMESMGTTEGTSFNFEVELWETNWYSVKALIGKDGEGRRAIAKEYTHQTCNANFGINFQFDLYPGETSWKVFSPSGEVVMSGGPYDYLPPNSYLSIQKCLPYGCYTLKIFDAYGDGICCDHGEGYYEFIGQNGNILTTGGDFGGIKSIYFCLENNEDDLSLNIDQIVPVSCDQGSDGTAIVSAHGGSGSYVYVWSNGSTGSTVNNLSAGVHSVTVYDGNSSLTSSLTITEPESININVVPFNIDCSASTAGSAVTEVSGGLPPYNYFWSTGATTPDINGLEPGTYNVSIVDANGCLQSASATVEQNNDLEILTTVVGPSCFGAANGVILASANGGSGDYTFLWNTGATTASIFDLPEGDYQVSVTDSNGCNGVKNAALTNPEMLKVESIVTEPACESASSGSIELVVEGGSPPYSYSWNTGQTSYNIFDLTSGSYTVTVVDANNCSEELAFELNIATPMQLYFQSVNATEGNNGSINLSIEGGIPPFSFEWSNGATTEDISDLSSGLYIVTVTDEGGCQAIGEVSIGAGEYCLLRGSNTNYEWIERVNWNGESSVTGPDGGQGLYHNVVFNAEKGSTYSLEAEPGYSATNYGESWRVWIDFNGDYDFSDPGEEVYAVGPSTGSMFANIEIPDDAITGMTIMRIAMKYGSLPPLCGTFGYGEVEEYSILIKNPGSEGPIALSDDEQTVQTGISMEDQSKNGTPVSITVFPNPANAFINIPLESVEVGRRLTCRIIGNEGRKVFLELSKLSEREPYWEIPVNKLPEGLYRMELSDEISVYISSFVISR